MTSPTDFFFRDDAIHPMDGPGYYEWWYLDAIFPSGWIATISLFWRCGALPVHYPLVQVDIYDPDRKKHQGIDGYAFDAAKGSTEKCDVTIGGNWLRQEGERWRLSARLKQAGADLTFTRTVPGWKVDPTGLIVDDATGKQGWCNPIPRADVEGTLYVDGRPIPVKGGIGYHDHNWGSVNIERSMGGWGWGRDHTDRYTFVYGWLMPVGNADAAMTPSFFVARGDKPIFVADGFPCKLSGFQKHAETGCDMPSVLEFGAKTPAGLEIETKLTLEKVLGWSQTESTPGVHTTYLRRISQFDARIGSKGAWDTTSGKAMDEYTVMPRK